MSRCSLYLCLPEVLHISCISSCVVLRYHGVTACVHYRYRDPAQAAGCLQLGVAGKPDVEGSGMNSKIAAWG